MIETKRECSGEFLRSLYWKIVLLPPQPAHVDNAAVDVISRLRGSHEISIDALVAKETEKKPH